MNTKYDASCMFHIPNEPWNVAFMDSGFIVAVFMFITVTLGWSCASNQGPFLESSIVVDSIVRIEHLAHDHPSGKSNARLVISFIDLCVGDAPAGCRVELWSTAQRRFIVETLLWDEAPYRIELEEDSVTVYLSANFRDLVEANKKIGLKSGETVYMSFLLGGGCGSYKSFYRR